TSPDGSSSTGPTVSSGIPLLELEVLGQARPLLRERRALSLVERELEDAEPEQRALEANGCERDAHFVEELVPRHRGDLLGRPALDHLHEHRRRRLADRAPAPAELHVLDLVP